MRKPFFTPFTIQCHKPKGIFIYSDHEYYPLCSIIDACNKRIFFSLNVIQKWILSFPFTALFHVFIDSDHLNQYTVEWDRSLKKYKNIEINWIQFVFNQFYVLVSNIFHLILWFENKSNFKRIFLVIDSAISVDWAYIRCRICSMCWTNFYFDVQ